MNWKKDQKLNEILVNFKMVKPKKKVFGNYRIEGNDLVYSTQSKYEDRTGDIAKITQVFENPRLLGDVIFRGEAVTLNYMKLRHEKKEHISGIDYTLRECDIIATKIITGDKTQLLGNSSTLPFVGRVVSYGNARLNRSETEIQHKMSLDADFILIPFSVFKEAKLDISKFKLLERGIAEKIEVKIEDRHDKKSTKTENRHFTGASLFEVEGRKYLFDLDRGEIKHKIFNPFLATILDKKDQVKTITQAYDALRPKAVIDALNKGLKVLRQGEWFFIPTKKPKIKKLTEPEKLQIALEINRFNRDTLLSVLNVKFDKKRAEKLLELLPRTQSIKAGKSRPNTVSICLKQNKSIFCSGLVKHTGREHKDLKLDGWYLAVPNTSVENFTITGDID